jgi:hypothetical protein
VDNQPSVWLPPTAGIIPPDVRQAQLAIEAYSPDLELGKDERRGTWCVVWKDGPGGAPFPALALTNDPSEPLPGYEQIQALLYKADVARQGREFMEKLRKEMEAERMSEIKELRQKAEDTAEHLEHAFRRAGKTAYTKVFVPDKTDIWTP